MNHRVALALASTISFGAVHAGQAPVPRLPVKTLIAYYSGEAGVPLHEQSAEALMNTRFADGYLAGVADGSQGELWCDKGTVKSDEINSMIVAELRKLPANEQAGSAAPAALRILERRFPCR